MLISPRHAQMLATSDGSDHVELLETGDGGLKSFIDGVVGRGERSARVFELVLDRS